MPDLGIVLDSFDQPVKDALQSAARLGFRQVEMPAMVREVFYPEELTRTGRRHLLHYVNGLGLRLSALGGDLGGSRFSDSAALDQRLSRSRQILELAAELGVPVVTTHLGRLDPETLQKGYLPEALRHLAEMSDRTGVLIAAETAAEPETLAALLRQVGAATLGTCYDPASLLIEGHDPLAGIEPLAEQIFIARVRDAVAGSGNRPGREMPIGQGQMDLPEYLAALDQAGYRQAPFVRRTTAERPLQELADAKARLEKLMG